MNKEEVLRQLEALNLDKKEYWTIAGTAMVLHGLRQETGDIDLGCTTRLADQLERHVPAQRLPDGTRRIALGERVELFENWRYDRLVWCDGIPTLSVKGLLQMKRQLNREKDQADIQTLEAYLQNQGKTH